MTVEGERLVNCFVYDFLSFNLAQDAGYTFHSTC